MWRISTLSCDFYAVGRAETFRSAPSLSETNLGGSDLREAKAIAGRRTHLKASNSQRCEAGLSSYKGGECVHSEPRRVDPYYGVYEASHSRCLYGKEMKIKLSSVTISVARATPASAGVEMN